MENDCLTSKMCHLQKDLEKLSVAIVADAFFTFSGAERVIAQILKILPQADLFSLVNFLPDPQRSEFLNRKIGVTFIQNLPFSSRLFRSYLPLWPLAMECLDLMKYDVVISSHNSVAHGVITSPSQLHIVYTHSPMRYAWDLQGEYLKDEKNPFRVAFAKYAFHKLRIWDTVAAQRADIFVANSNFVARRISKYYKRSSTVIYPPVKQPNVPLKKENQGDYYIYVGRLVSYKRVDLLVSAFNSLPEKKLVIVGQGPELRNLKRMAKTNIVFTGWLSDEEKYSVLASAKAFVFAGVEDFGIAPVEAQQLGIAVIAFREGGVAESTISHPKPNATGVLFDQQNPDALVAAILDFEAATHQILSQDCRNNADRFSEAVFREKFAGVLSHGISQRRRRLQVEGC